MFIFLILSVLFASTQATTIYVDSTSGNDSLSCLEGKDICLTLTFALQGAHRSGSVLIFLSEGNYSLVQNTSLTTLNYKTGFGIIGQPYAIISCETGAGFSFNSSVNIQFSNVTLDGCGVYHNSTSRSSYSDLKYLQFRVAIYFIFCSNVLFDSVIVSNSNGLGVVFYSTVGRNIIRYSNFTNNMADETEPGGGGVAIEFLYCIPGDLECNSTYGSTIPAKYTNGIETEAVYEFDSCRFNHNAGNVSTDLYIVPRAEDNVALGRGGGLSIVYKGNVTNIPVHITNCVFYNNTAIWGGGLLVEFQDRCYSNLVVVESTVFLSNKCNYSSCTYEGTGGGGARVLFAGIGHYIYNNTVLFKNSSFTNNHAYFGGGVSFLTFRENVSQVHKNSFRFESCRWHGNIARLGSAVDLTLWHLETSNDGSVITKPIFVNCVFESNSVEYTNYTSTPAGIGTVYIDSVPVQFQDDNLFINNDGSAIVSLDAAVEFRDDSMTLLSGNHGRVGGGVTLFNKGFILLNANSSIKFINNKASLHGGGLYWENIGDHQLISSRNCFIRYSDVNIEPAQWPVSILFNGNHANLSGQAIYATTILGCLWGGLSHGELVNPKVNDFIDKVFCWNESIWNYGTDTCNGTNVIATAPAYYADKEGNPQCHNSYSIVVIPGKPATLPVVMLDDRLNQVPRQSLIFSVFRNSTYDSVTEYITQENITFLGNPILDAEAVLYLKTIHPRVISTKIDLTFEQCPPGFVINANSLVCEGIDYPNVRIHSNFTAYIEFGYWMGTTDSNDNGIMVGQCLYCPLNSDLHKKSYVALPDSPNKLDDFFCGELNREGVTCARCKSNYSVAVNSKRFECVPCAPNSYLYSWILYALAEYVPLMLMLIIVIVFNISVTSGPANSFIFFAQIISTTFGIDANGIIDYQSVTPAASAFKQIYSSIYGLWNLSFFTAVDLNGWLFCLGPKITSLHIMILKFASAFFPLLVIGPVVILLHFYHNNYKCVVCIVQPLHKLTARCFRWLNFQRSLMDAFATFIILSYVKFAVTSCQLLFPNTLVNATGHQQIISLFNGDLRFFSLEYAPYLAVSILVLCFCVLLPFLLFLYSIKPCYTCLQRFNCHVLQPEDKAQQFLDSFHQCFKDGRNGEHDRRYFAALYFFLKLFLIATFAFGLSWTIQYICQQFICTVALLLLGSLQPYKKMLHNVLDLSMFSILSTINVITLYNYYLQAVNSPLPPSLFWFQIILIFIPLVYFVVYISYFLYKAIKMKCCWKKRRIVIEDQRDLDEFSFNTFMTAVNREDRFQQNHFYGSLIPDELTRGLGGGLDCNTPGHCTIKQRCETEIDIGIGNTDTEPLVHERDQYEII